MAQLFSSFILLASLVLSTPATSQAQANEAQAATRSNSGPATAIPVDYVIGPEDVLGVVFWREPEMSGDVTVRPDGRVSIPVIGEMRAAGLEPETLRQQILTAARKYITDPNIVVVVRAINSRKVFITGRVTTPGAHPIVGPLTVMQAIALAGGLTEYADTKNIRVLREESTGTTTIKVNYRDISKGNNLAQNIQLRPGDTVVVP